MQNLDDIALLREGVERDSEEAFAGWCRVAYPADISSAKKIVRFSLSRP